MIASVAYQRLPQVSTLGVLCLYFAGCPVEAAEPLRFMGKHRSTTKLLSHSIALDSQGSEWVDLHLFLFVGWSTPKHSLHGSSDGPAGLGHDTHRDNCVLITYLWISFSSFSVSFSQPFTSVFGIDIPK